MGLFDAFRKRKYEKEETESKNELPEIREEDFIDNSEPTEQQNNIITLEFGTKLPIDIIYSFLKEDYENKAYRDALTNPDKSYKEKNLAIIRSSLEVKFNQVLLKYEDLLREINFHIQSRSQAGLTDIVELLKSKKTTYEKHVEELKKMQHDLEQGASYMTGSFMTYEVGFTRGLASMSIHELKINDTI